MENILLLASLAGTAAFGGTFIALAMRKPPAPKQPEVTTESLARGAGIPTPEELGNMAEKFKNSGPQATAASPTIFFFTAALMVGGVLNISLDAGGAATEAAATE